MKFLKQTLHNTVNKLGYEITKKKSGFSLHSNLLWLKELNINTILDVGANNGGFASFINNILPGVTIYSFEPIKSCFDELSKKKPIIKGLIPMNFALGDKNGEMDFFVNDFSFSSSFLRISDISKENFPFTKNQTISKVAIKRLDDIYEDLSIKPEVLVKIDVQGFEEQVLKGGMNFISNIPRILFIETGIKPLYENEPSFNEIFNMMISMGFSYAGNLDQLYSPLDGSILQTDVIFIK